jgi:alkylation response protein AidB-like acyl-CoA dehydrogenase
MASLPYRGTFSTFAGRQETQVHFEFNDKVKNLQGRLQAFLDEHIYPNERRFEAEIEQNRWKPTRIVEELKLKARAAGLWNLFLADSEQGAGLTNLEYAPLCEMIGRAVLQQTLCVPGLIYVILVMALTNEVAISASPLSVATPSTHCASA